MGVLLYELLCLNRPFEGKKGEGPGVEMYTLNMAIMDDDFKPIDDSYSSDMKKLVKQCLTKALRQRPNAFELVNENSFVKKSIARMKKGDLKPFELFTEDKMDPEKMYENYLLRKNSKQD